MDQSYCDDALPTKITKQRNEIMDKKSTRILCVEDEQDIRENIAEILRDEGFEVFEASNGKLGFEVFVASNPDIIISDIMMPEIDGYGLLNNIREKGGPKGLVVPFIFLTALIQKEDVIKGLSLSANDYLTKPVDFDLMIAKVEEKVSNLKRVQKNHNRNIQNIKDQVAVMLPKEISSYLNSITQIAGFLKNEPYGPMPHRKYLEDIDKIYTNSIKLGGVIASNICSIGIDQRIDPNEEIIVINTLIEYFIGAIVKKFGINVKVNYLKESNKSVKIRIEKEVLLELLKKIFLFVLSLDKKLSVDIKILIDPLDRINISFLFTSENKYFNCSSISNQSNILRDLSLIDCELNLSEKEDNNLILIIPAHRKVG